MCIPWLQTQKGYCCFDPIHCRSYISIDVTFNENMRTPPHFYMLPNLHDGPMNPHLPYPVPLDSSPNYMPPSPQPMCRPTPRVPPPQLISLLLFTKVNTIHHIIFLFLFPIHNHLLHFEHLPFLLPPLCHHIPLLRLC